MLTIEVDRFGFGLDSTLSRITLSNDPAWSCFAVEDERRKIKVPGETCIMPGQYPVGLRTDSPKFESPDRKDYPGRFPGLHRGMLHIQDVPGFEWVYFHVGNRERHTEGCILPGVAPICLPTGEFMVGQSELAYIALYTRVMAAMDAGEKVYTFIRERERER